MPGILASFCTTDVAGRVMPRIGSQDTGTRAPPNVTSDVGMCWYRSTLIDPTTSTLPLSCATASYAAHTQGTHTTTSHTRTHANAKDNMHP